MKPTRPVDIPTEMGNVLGGGVVRPSACGGVEFTPAGLIYHAAVSIAGVALGAALTYLHAQETRQKTPAPRQEPLVVVIDGEIGAGKTTLIEHLRKALEEKGMNVAVVAEPVDKWQKVGILSEFYADKSPDLRGPVAYNFQTYTFVTRVDETRSVVDANPDADVFLLERSIWTDRYVFMELLRDLVGPMYMSMYEEWWGSWAHTMPLCPQKIVYLKPTISVCQDRVNERAREGEIVDDCNNGDRTARGGVSTDYQARLRVAHEAYLQGFHPKAFPKMPPPPFSREDVVVVEGTLADHDFSKPGDAADQTVRHIVDRILG